MASWNGTVKAAILVVAGSALLMSSAFAQGAKPTLNIYNWSDYIAPDTVPNFTKETGIAVNYDVYDANETLEAKLSAGKSGYDLVVPSLMPFLARQVKAGFYLTLDKSKLANYGNLSKPLLERMAQVDPGNAHAIPWMTGTDGLAINVDKVKALLPDAPTNSLALLFDPKNAAKLKGCGISIIDSPTDVFPAALKYLGLDPDSQKTEDLNKAAELLTKIRPYIRKFDSSDYINDLANGDLCLAFGYSSDINLAKRRADEAAKGVHVAYVIPKEGALRWIDTMAIPKDAPHPELALKFMDYIMRPEVIAETSNTIPVANGNAAATKFVKPEIANDPGIYPPEDVVKTLYDISVSTPAVDRTRTRLWTKVKTRR
ncbi:MAG TPA: polyamine ABC transporter substrate-binding protein [Stellaceae bacterium]|nr:polyamine ABC transporter substrate-binding protein [Stellaceae bacterium]